MLFIYHTQAVTPDFVCITDFLNKQNYNTLPHPKLELFSQNFD